ncbi:transcription termination factor 1-like, partial [Diadema antillarum]|uniref:transcription termination factor 1-like n=2 Tax=Diadema antillarum TaxID=105358 RepID=UPI003A887FCA
SSSSTSSSDDGIDDSSDMELEENESELYASNVHRMDAETRQALRDRGIVVKEGLWSGMEDKRLKENMANICQKYKIDEPRKIIFPDEYPDSKELRTLIMEKNIYMRLSKGIQRPTYNVYIRARKIFDPLNYLGHFSKDEVKKMKRLARKMGPQWSQIGKMMGRSGRSLCDRFKISITGQEHGLWSERERQKLIDAVKEASGFNRTNDVNRLFYKIPWTAVQQKMKTRNVLQCRSQWLFIVSWAAAEYQTRHTAKKRWTSDDNVKLIEKIYKLDVNDEQDIDWLSVLDDFPNVPSPQKLRLYFHQLKVRYIPDYRFKIYDDIVCHLHDYALPDLCSKSGPYTTPGEVEESEEEVSGEEGDEDCAPRGGAMEERVPEQHHHSHQSNGSGGEASNSEAGERVAGGTEDGSLNPPAERRKRKKRKKDRRTAQERQSEMSDDGSEGSESSQGHVRQKKRKIELLKSR